MRKSNIGMIAALGMAMAGGAHSPRGYGGPTEIRGRSWRSDEDKARANGLRKFEFSNGSTIYAINKKNAIKKYAKANSLPISVAEADIYNES